MPYERRPVGPIISPNSGGGDTVADAPKGECDQAIAVPLNPKLAESYYNRGIAYGQNGNYCKAIADLTEAIRLNPQSAPAHYNRGVFFWHTGNPDRAAADFNEAVRLDPKLAVAYYGRGCAHWYYGQTARAEMDFAQAKRLGYASPRPSSTNIIQKSLSILGGAVSWL